MVNGSRDRQAKAPQLIQIGRAREVAKR